MSRAVLDLGPGSLDSPLALSVTDYLCDTCTFLILSSCHLGLPGIQTTVPFEITSCRGRRPCLSRLVGSSGNGEKWMDLRAILKE